MKIRSSTLLALGICAVVAMLAGCGGQSQVTPTSAMRTAHISDAGGESTGKQHPARKRAARLQSVHARRPRDVRRPGQRGVDGEHVRPRPDLEQSRNRRRLRRHGYSGSFPGVLLRRTRCYVSVDCSLANAFKSQNGALTQLSALGPESAAASSINSNGDIAGIAENGETDPLYPGFPELRAVLWKGLTDHRLRNLWRNGELRRQCQ